MRKSSFVAMIAGTVGGIAALIGGYVIIKSRILKMRYEKSK